MTTEMKVVLSQVVFKLFSSYFQVVFKLFSSYFQVIFKLFSSYFQVVFKLFSVATSKVVDSSFDSAYH